MIIIINVEAIILVPDYHSFDVKRRTAIMSWMIASILVVIVLTFEKRIQMQIEAWTCQGYAAVMCVFCTQPFTCILEDGSCTSIINCTGAALLVGCMHGWQSASRSQDEPVVRPQSMFAVFEQVAGQALLPAAAMLEAAAATGRALLSSTALPTLVKISIPAPLILHTTTVRLS